MLTFTKKRWRKLAAAAEKANHTLENCTACALQHEDIQEAFPGPTFKPGLHSIYETATTSRKDEKAVTKKVLQHVNASHTVCNKYTVSSTVKITLCLLSYTQDKYGHTLTESAVALFPELHLAKKPTPNEARALKRKRDRQVRNQENETHAKIIPRQILASSTASVSLYLNRRREQNFIGPQQPGKVKSHSPADTSHWDVPSAMDMLRNWPQNSTINWSAEAEKLGIEGANSGQVLKETATGHGIMTEALDGRSGRCIRARKRRLPRSDISVGCGPGKKALQSRWEEMVEIG